MLGRGVVWGTCGRGSYDPVSRGMLREARGAAGNSCGAGGSGYIAETTGNHLSPKQNCDNPISETSQSQRALYKSKSLSEQHVDYSNEKIFCSYLIWLNKKLLKINVDATPPPLLKLLYNIFILTLFI